jgi:hypothetical protein
VVLFENIEGAAQWFVALFASFPPLPPADREALYATIVRAAGAVTNTAVDSITAAATAPAPSDFLPSSAATSSTRPVCAREPSGSGAEAVRPPAGGTAGRAVGEGVGGGADVDEDEEVSPAQLEEIYRTVQSQHSLHQPKIKAFPGGQVDSRLTEAFSAGWDFLLRRRGSDPPSSPLTQGIPGAVPRALLLPSSEVSTPARLAELTVALRSAALLDIKEPGSSSSSAPLPCAAAMFRATTLMEDLAQLVRDLSVRPASEAEADVTSDELDYYLRHVKHYRQRQRAMLDAGVPTVHEVTEYARRLETARAPPEGHVGRAAFFDAAAGAAGGRPTEGEGSRPSSLSAVLSGRGDGAEDGTQLTTLEDLLRSLGGDGTSLDGFSPLTVEGLGPAPVNSGVAQGGDEDADGLAVAQGGEDDEERDSEESSVRVAALLRPALAHKKMILWDILIGSGISEEELKLL